MLKLCICTICLSALMPPGQAQDKPASQPEAQVTCYSTGSIWKTVEPGYKHGAFKGVIFDDNQPLAQMKESRFVTFTFLPGEHMFSANYWFDKSAKGGAHLKLNLAPGAHYYIATYMNYRPVLIAPIPLMDQSSCGDAQKDAAAAKPLPKSDLEKPAIPYLVQETSFPGCS